MVRQGAKPATAGASDLLNFHFASAPPSREQQQQSFGRNHHRPAGSSAASSSHNNNNSNIQYRRSKEDRASARRKASSAMFYLHASADHAFCLTRRGPLRQQQQQQLYSFNGPDASVSWESVRTVKYLSTAQKQENCPVCLDSFTCVRITKCGHCFCLPCILRHVHSCCTTGNGEPKCPCCSIPLHLQDLRPVELLSVIAPALQQHVRLTKLHRSKACPAPFLPRADQPRRSSPTAAPTSPSDADAAFCKFNYVDPTAYQQHLTSNLRELLEQQHDQAAGGNRNVAAQDPAEAVSYSMAVETVQRELQAALEESSREFDLAERFASPSAGMYQPHPPQLLAATYTTAAMVQQQQQSSSSADETGSDLALESVDSVPVIPEATSWESSSPTATRYRGDSVGSEYSHQSSTAAAAVDPRRARGDSIASYDADSSPRSIGSPRRKDRDVAAPVASMYLDTDESVFYQAQDGQLCFLSGFNMNCLRTEFSATLPEDETALLSNLSVQERRKMSPLPDTIEGKIVEIERTQLTPEIRQRLRFLSHLPLYSDITLVEIGLGSLLSAETKKVFKKDFHKRKQARLNKLGAEKRQDERVRCKEEARINELKSRMKRIDPSDEFFQPYAHVEAPLDFTGDDFVPLVLDSGETVPARYLASHAAPAHPTVSFSAITRTGGAFPALGLARGESEFPSLGSTSNAPPSTTRVPKAQPSWGRPVSTSKPVDDGDTPRLAPAPTVGGKKKSKGKKVVLFSTGAHRGGK